VESGDLAQIESQGYLRVLNPPFSHLEYLPREGYPQDLELDLLETFTQSLGLRLGFVTVEHYQDLIPALLEGRGDIIAANFTVTPERKKQVGFSVPLMTVREQIVTRTSDQALTKLTDLKDRTLTIRKSSAYWQTAQTLKTKYPGLTIEEAPDFMDTEQILDHVANGAFDATLADSNLVKAVLQYRSDIRPAFDVTADRPIAWATRPQAINLLIALNGFLNQARLAVRPPSIAKHDLPGIRNTQVLRVLTRNNPATYFLWRGELLGFEYELARHFAKQQKLRVEMVVPPMREDLIPWLLEGKGDLIAASMTISDQRESQGIEFSRPYLTASEIVVARAEEPLSRLASPGDLVGRTVVVRKSSSYWDTRQDLQKQGIAVTVQASPEDLETEESIARVA